MCHWFLMCVGQIIGICYYCRIDLMKSDPVIVCHDHGKITRQFHAQCGLKAMRGNF